MATPRSVRGRNKQRAPVTPTRSSPRIVRRSTSYPNAVNRHFVDSVPILEVTLRFDEDEYDVWRRQDTDEVNLYYMLRIKYPRDEDEEAWHQELEKLKRELNQVRVVEEGWFEGVWVPLEKAKDIARKYKIYDHVAALLESENSWFDTPKTKQTRVKNEQRSPSISVSEYPDTPNGITGGTSTSPMPNGTSKSETISKSEVTKVERPRTRSMKSESKDLPLRLREVEGERDHYKKEAKHLKRRLDETESFVNHNSGSAAKRRAMWAAIGAAVGAAFAAIVLNNMGISIGDIASGFANYTGLFG